MNEQVRIQVTEGPIIIQNHTGTSVESEHVLWDTIVATESFPAGASKGANYVLTLSKEVGDLSEIGPAEAELSKALLQVAAAWVFSGGSHMVIKRVETIRSARFTSNADEVRQKMLAETGLTAFSASMQVPISFGAEYSQAPLEFAAAIARLMKRDFFVNRLLGYYQHAYEASSTALWAITLYKIRDLLQKKIGTAAETRDNLVIDQNEWREFGKLLNSNDLRHAEISDTFPTISPPEINQLNAIARAWIAKFLKMQGVNAIG